MSGSLSGGGLPPALGSAEAGSYVHLPTPFRVVSADAKPEPVRRWKRVAWRREAAVCPGLTRRFRDGLAQKRRTPPVSPGLTPRHPGILTSFTSFSLLRCARQPPAPVPIDVGWRSGARGRRLLGVTRCRSGPARAACDGTWASRRDSYTGSRRFGPLWSNSRRRISSVPSAATPSFVWRYVALHKRLPTAKRYSV